ncbi:MAG: hypothetical protein AB7C95_04680 [Synergistaceae bacterium]
MADYRTIKPTIWSDPYFEELNTDEKLLYIYLFSNPHINNAGVMKVSKRKIIFETYMTEEKYDSAIQKFENDKKVMLFDEYIYVCKFIKHQTNTSPKMLVNIHKQLELIPKDIVSVINRQYPELKIPSKYLIDTPNIPLIYPTDGLERELEEEREIEEEEEIPPYSPPLENPIENIDLPDFLDRETWVSWVRYLRKKDNPLLEESAHLQIRKLIQWHAQGHDTADIINRSIMNGYKGLTEPTKKQEANSWAK